MTLKQMNVAVYPEMLEWVDKQAAERETNRSAFMRVMIRKAMREAGQMESTQPNRPTQPATTEATK